MRHINSWKRLWSERKCSIFITLSLRISAFTTSLVTLSWLHCNQPSHFTETAVSHVNAIRRLVLIRSSDCYTQTGYCRVQGFISIHVKFMIYSANLEILISLTIVYKNICNIFATIWTSYTVRGAYNRCHHWNRRLFASPWNRRKSRSRNRTPNRGKNRQCERALMEDASEAVYCLWTDLQRQESWRPVKLFEQGRRRLEFSSVFFKTAFVQKVIRCM